MKRAMTVLAGFLVTSGCASVESRLPQPSTMALAQETRSQADDALKRYQNHALRLAGVGHKIVKANAPLCKKTRLDAGLVLHSQAGYAKDMRAAAQRTLFAGEAPSIFIITVNGPSHDLPIAAGDQVLNQKDQPADIRDELVQKDLSAGIIRIRRGGEMTIHKIRPDTVCDYPVRLKVSGAVNAYADGRSVIVTTGMMDFVKSDEELALVIGHELAHNTKGHIRKGIWNAVITGYAKRYLRPFEAEADYVGLYYMARAGFDIEGVENFWKRLGTQNPKMVVTAKTHPVTPQRFLSLKLTQDEIARKRANGEALIPNLKSDP